MRILYVSSGRADIIGAHRNWRSGVDDPSQASITFSSQIEEFVDQADATALMLSFRDMEEALDDGRFALRHLLGHDRGGIAYHLETVRRARAVMQQATSFRPDVLLVDSGAIPYYTLPWFRRRGIRVIPILHNALWPADRRSRSLKDRILSWLDRRFWRSTTDPVIAVSPEGARQVHEVQPARQSRTIVIAAQFRRGYFDAIAPSPPHERPFNVMFVGRAVRNKGLLMLADMAAHAEQRQPGLLRWTVCGDGPDLPALREQVAARSLGDVFDIRGWTSPDDLQRVYGSVHAVIVPTMSDFNEGLAMTAVEAILARRPLVSNPVVPALELLESAAMSARTDDPISHADAVLALATDADLYERKRRACAEVGHQFTDERFGLRAGIAQAIETLPTTR